MKTAELQHDLRKNSKSESDLLNCGLFAVAVTVKPISLFSQLRTDYVVTVIGRLASMLCGYTPERLSEYINRVNFGKLRGAITRYGCPGGKGLRFVQLFFALVAIDCRKLSDIRNAYWFDLYRSRYDLPMGRFFSQIRLAARSGG